MLSSSSSYSTPLSAFSASDNPSVLTPSSQYSIGNSNTLNELIETERNYLETLKIIDSRLTSIWMKQTIITAPDFSELLKHINEISKVNKQFYTRLQRIYNNSQGEEELIKELVSWVDDLEVPYTNYCRSYIPQLNQRKDILSNVFISSLLQDLFDGTSLESLFNMPLEQLKYYESLYNRLLNDKDSDSYDYRSLNSAIKKMNVVLSMSQKASKQVQRLHIQTGFESELKLFENQVDCSRTMDFLKGTYIDYKQFRISNMGSELVVRDSFGLVSNQQNGTTVKVHLVLTTEVLVICRELNNQNYSLMFPPIPIGDIVVKVDSAERCFFGEYIITFSMLNRRNLIFCTDSLETRNTWVGLDQNKPVSVSQCSLNIVAQKIMLAPLETSNNSISEGETHSFAHQSAKLLLDNSVVSQQRSLNNSPHMNAKQPLKDGNHVQLTYIQPPTSKMESISISDSTVDHSPSSSSSRQMNSNMNSDKTSSPRAIEMQKAIIPETMQAVTQNTEEYLKNSPNIKNSIPGSHKPHNPQQISPRPTNYNNMDHSPRPNLQTYNSRPCYPQGYVPQYTNRPIPAKSNQRFNPQPPVPPHKQVPGSYQVTSSQQKSFHTQHNNAPSKHGHPNSSNPSPLHAQSNGSLNEEWNSPPHSPSANTTNNSIKQILYSNNTCVVFHWVNQSWYAADGPCMLQVRLTHKNRTCMTVELKNTKQLYLNAWILPNTEIKQTSPTDVSISVYIGAKKENYLVHFNHPQDANYLLGLLNDAHRQVSQPTTSIPDIEDEVEPVDNVQCPQVLTPVMQCKAKLYVQTETSKWNTFGNVSIMISQQSPSMRMMIQIENNKTKLVSAVVRSGNVEKISSKRISFLLSDEIQKTSIVYMIQLREDQTGEKIYDYLRVKNSGYGW